MQICLFFVQYCTSAFVHARAKSAVAQLARAVHMQKVQIKNKTKSKGKHLENKRQKMLHGYRIGYTTLHGAA